ncbi:MAG TPA: SpoIIE family protein phosphatase [Kouleothrix sp.]|uniref:PP2C family protein-serine/threonine phosphatase n=1 Tax=Kouleothrix sp. TaxID=2779161 RepID=UPI002B5B1610|nr:SpoIIE family protein phosphatase [Kouleothrix sp.]
MLERMRTLGLFGRTNDARLAELAAQLPEQRLAAGDVLFVQGAPGYTCYMVLSGELEAVAHQGDFAQRLEVCLPGRIIGEMALIDGSPRSATVRALADSSVAVFDERAFTELMLSSPELTLDLLRGSTARLRRTSQLMIDDLAAKHAELARAYADLEAAQAERVRLVRLEEELAVARRIQSLFLPRTIAQPPGWQIAAVNRGAHEVGGDFFDCIPLDGGRLGLVIADACGKGVPAALFVALTRSLVRASSQAPRMFRHEHEAGADALLADTLRFANEYIATEHGASSMFITLFYAVLTPASGELSFVNAGHNSPMLLGPGGVLRAELESSALPIGIVPGQAFEVGHARLAPGDTLVCFTDGITEAMNAGNELFGEPRLLAALRAHAGLPAAALIDRVIAEVEVHAGGAPQSDDLTLLVVRREAA